MSGGGDVIVYSGLQADVFKFIIFYLDLFLTAMCAASLSLVIGASVNNFSTGQLMLVMTFVLMMVRASDYAVIHN